METIYPQPFTPRFVNSFTVFAIHKTPRRLHKAIQNKTLRPDSNWVYTSITKYYQVNYLPENVMDSF